MDDPPTDTLDSRRRFVEDTTSFIVQECSFLGDLLAEMHWTPEYILRKKMMNQCPHDCLHYLAEDSLKKHTLKCELLKRGCPREDLQLQMQSGDVLYEKAELVGKVQIDENLLNTIIQRHYMESGQVFTGHRALPTCSTDACVTMPREERIAVYDYCVQQLKAQGKMPNVEKDEILTTDWEKIIKKGLLEQEEGKPQTAQELLALLRDQKRRRQSYRAKNVHITRKTYTEIIREVINNQIEMLMPSQEVLKRPDSHAKECITADRKEEGSPNHRWHRSREGSRDSYSRDHSPRPRQRGSREKTKKVRRHGDSQSSERDQQQNSCDLVENQGKTRDRKSPCVVQKRKRHADDSDSDSRRHSKKHKRKHKKHKRRHGSSSDDSSMSCR